MKLSTRLSLYAACISLAIGLGITFTLEYSAARNERKDAERLTELMQKQLVRNIGADLRNVERQVERTALEMALSRAVFTERNAGIVLRIMLESDSLIQGCCVAFLPEYAPPTMSEEILKSSVASISEGREWMMYADRNPDGTIRERFLHSPEYPYTGMAWFRDAIEKRQGIWSLPYLDAGGGGMDMITFSYPLPNSQDNIYAVATADVSIKSLAATIERLKPYKDSRSFLMLGDSIVGSSRQEFYSETGHNTDDYIICRQPIGGMDLAVCTVTPVSTVLSLMNSVRIPLIVIMIAGIVLLLIVVRMVIVRTLRPLNNLSEAARKIGDGDFGTPLPDSVGFSELETLRNAMAGMGQSIREHVREIADNARRIQRIESELTIARRIQSGMLPDAWDRLLPSLPPEEREAMLQLTVAASLQPAREVSGDLYDYLPVGNKLVFAIADVSDKGVPASLVMSQIKNLFHFIASGNPQPAAILDELNRSLASNNPHNMFVTMIIGVADPIRQTLTLANAGHNPPVMISGGEARLLRLDSGIALGVLEDIAYTQQEFAFRNSDMVFLYTDGLTEATDSTGVEYGEERLVKTIDSSAATGNADANAIISSIRRDIDGFAHGAKADDVTLLCIGIRDSENKVNESGYEENIYQKHFEYDIGELNKLQDFIDRVWKQENWPDSEKFRTTLVAEEALSNVIRYSRPSQAGDSVKLTIKRRSEGISMSVEDGGPRFNPLEDAPTPNLTDDAESRPIGGLGIFLIRENASSLNYEYTNNNNIFTINLDFNEAL